MDYASVSLFEGQIQVWAAVLIVVVGAAVVFAAWVHSNLLGALPKVAEPPKRYAEEANAVAAANRAGELDRQAMRAHLHAKRRAGTAPSAPSQTNSSGGMDVGTAVVIGALISNSMSSSYSSSSCDTGSYSSGDSGGSSFSGGCDAGGGF